MNLNSLKFDLGHWISEKKINLDQSISLSNIVGKDFIYSGQVIEKID